MFKIVNEEETYDYSIEEKREDLKARFSFIKTLPFKVANKQLLMDQDLKYHIKEVIEYDFYKGFIMLGGLEFDNFEISDSDIENEKFEYKFNGKIYMSLKLLHMLTNSNEDVKEKEKEIIKIIEDYYDISYNIEFSFDEKENIKQVGSLATNVKRWIKMAGIEYKDITTLEEDVLNILDKYSNEAVLFFVSSIKEKANKEMERLLK